MCIVCYVYMYILYIHYAIGSWMPVGWKNGTVEKVEYIMKVQVINTGKTMVIHKEFFEYCNLYSDLSIYIDVAFGRTPIGAMNNKFVDDRLREWVTGFSDERCDSRRSMLDVWIKEIISTPLLMTDINAYNIICKFCNLVDLIII